MFEQHHYEIGGTLVAFDAAADELLKFRPVTPIIVVRWGALVLVSCTGTTGFAAKLSLRPTPEIDTARMETWGGTITPGELKVAGLIMQHTLSEGDGLNAVVATRTRAKVLPGEELVIETTVGYGTAGDGVFFIEYEPLAAQGIDVLTSLGGEGNCEEYAA